MRVRFRRSFILKLAVVAVLLFFAVPLLFFRNNADGSSLEFKKKFLADRKIAKDSLKVLEPPNQLVENFGQNVVDNPIDGKSGGEGDEPKSFGPQAVFQKGVLGNFEPEEQYKTGPGERGEPVYTSMDERGTADRSLREFGFNMVNSDKISMDRTIPDTRESECKYWHYSEQLPKASVILVFHNEGWSTLMRTVHSIINTSPPQFLEEVVMVDDFSTKEHLKGKLEDYIKQFNGKVKLYRNSERLGLIGTRTRGAELSKGDVIIFLDAHCECNRNWLPPLLQAIKHDRTTMAVPIVDGIDWDNFRYHPVYTTTHHRGIFEWGFLYKESQVPKKELATRTHHTAPYKSPTHAGGLFAMDKKYFFEMGAYDPGLQIWGGENFELSFKIWQCGGNIVWVPCSRVGHVYRNHMPYGFGKINHKIPVILLNYMRVVEVWLDDEFKEYFYTREPTIRGYPIGDISKQLQFKKDHKCKSFKWFMDNIAYEVYERFPQLPPNKAWGEIKQKGTSMCWDSLGQSVGGGAIGVSHCHHFGGNQLYRLNTKGQIGMGERCITAPNGNTLHISFCDTQPTGPWDWDETQGLMHHKDYQKCVEVGSDNKFTLQPCDATSKSQRFEIKEIRTWQ